MKASAVKSGASMLAERTRLALVRPELLREAACINGQWVSGQSRLEVVNPASGRLLGTVPSLGAKEAMQAVASAHQAFFSWRAKSATERGSILRRWCESIVTHAEDLARLMTAEQGKPLPEARGEISYAASFLEWFAEEARRSYGAVIPGHLPDKRLMVLKEPVGVVGAITPWNFPAAMITRKVAPALAMGCAVVLKPSDLTPFSALALAFLGQEAGLPNGVFNVITGEPQAIGEVLTTDARVRKFTFTGSTRIGKLLAARCMGTVKRVSLELGGNLPFIVFDDADIDKAVEGALASKFRNTGQTCVCANRFLVLANDTNAGLAAYVYTRDLSRSWRVSEALEYGMVGLNTGLISTTVAPFGGVKESGLGREGSHYGIQDYLDTKLVCTEISAS
jgi:succinate-semialdehyde dehydrogenase/glutarate-semialdehyde dehydrogenase